MTDESCGELELVARFDGGDGTVGLCAGAGSCLAAAATPLDS
jgi:hypothetical protein